MTQTKENFSNSGEFNVYIPKNSTDISSGDVVVMPQKYNPKSRSRLGALGRISPIASGDAAPWCVGVCDSEWNTNIKGSVKYAAPASTEALTVRRSGVYKLAMVDTSGTAGDFVRFSSGASGAQLFTIDNKRRGWAIGILEKTYSGATANDVQLVRLIEKNIQGPDLANWYENRIIKDCTVRVPYVVTALCSKASSQIRIGYTFGNTNVQNRFVIQGKHFSAGRDTWLAVALHTGGAVSAARLWMVVARSGGFGVETCTAKTSPVLATYTVAAVTPGMFVPKTMTSGEICIGYVIAHSGKLNMSAGRILPVVGPYALPRHGHWSV